MSKNFEVNDEIYVPQYEKGQKPLIISEVGAQDYGIGKNKTIRVSKTFAEKEKFPRETIIGKVTFKESPKSSKSSKSSRRSSRRSRTKSLKGGKRKSRKHGRKSHRKHH